MCVHHWKIEAPVARTSQGRCQRCGASREFLNVPERPGRFDGDYASREPARAAMRSSRQEEIRLSDDTIFAA